VTALLRAVLPAQWRPYRARDVVVLARPPVDTGWFRTTLLLARDDVPARVPVPALFDATRDRLDELGDDVEIVGDRYALDDDHERASRLVCFDVRSGCGGRVAQLQCFVARRPTGDHPRTVAQFVGTCAFEELDRYGPAFVRVVESIRVDRQPPANG
jgi:hypothetical protein